MLRSICLCITLMFLYHSNAKELFNRDTLNSRKEGKKQGIWEKKYFLSKKRKSICEFENGKRSGYYYKYYKSGFLKISGKYNNNKKDEFECFYMDRVRFESRKRCIVYKNGKKKETIKYSDENMFN
jgi:antitoxin component YwqK of YwqJK toxin-antitoxin module